MFHRSRHQLSDVGPGERKTIRTGFGYILTIAFLSIPMMIFAPQPSVWMETPRRQLQSPANSNAQLAEHALACLRKTTPDLHNITYLSDAEVAHRHAAEIHEGLAPWIEPSQPHCAAGYCGPWIENVWIDTFSSRSNKKFALHGPYIPLFIPWTDIWVGNGYSYPPGFADTLRSLLRPDILYITISQNDEGIAGKESDNLPMDSIPNVLVLSAGGYGHVPIPLLKQDESLISRRKRRSRNRKWLLSYVGDLTHAPSDMRQTMHDTMVAQTTKVHDHPSNSFYTHYHGDNWRNIMMGSYVSLVPRGFGRTSYHLMETLQQGLIPVYVYMETPWIPYRTLYESELGFLTTTSDLPHFVARLQSLSPSELLSKEDNIASYRHTHFSWPGILEQIRNFMVAPHKSDLECAALPATTRLS